MSRSYLVMLVTHLLIRFLSLIFVGSLSLLPDSSSAPDEVLVALDESADPSDWMPSDHNLIGQNAVDQNLSGHTSVDQDSVDQNTIPQSDTSFATSSELISYASGITSDPTVKAERKPLRCENRKFALCCTSRLGGLGYIFAPRTRFGCLWCKSFFFSISSREIEVSVYYFRRKTKK